MIVNLVTTVCRTIQRAGCCYYKCITEAALYLLRKHGVDAGAYGDGGREGERERVRDLHTHACTEGSARSTQHGEA